MTGCAEHYQRTPLTHAPPKRTRARWLCTLGAPTDHPCRRASAHRDLQSRCPSSTCRPDRPAMATDDRCACCPGYPCPSVEDCRGTDLAVVPATFPCDCHGYGGGPCGLLGRARPAPPCRCRGRRAPSPSSRCRCRYRGAALVLYSGPEIGSSDHVRPGHGHGLGHGHGHGLGLGHGHGLEALAQKSICLEVLPIRFAWGRCTCCTHCGARSCGCRTGRRSSRRAWCRSALPAAAWGYPYS